MISRAVIILAISAELFAMGAETLAATTDFRILPAPENEFTLDVAKTGLLSGKKHHFVLQRYEGRIRFDRESPANSSVEITVQSASAVCTDRWISASNLKKVQAYALNDMLEAAKYPQISFSSMRIIARDAGQYDVEGTLKIRDVARPVVVAVKLAEASSDRLLITGVAEVKLKDFGLKPPTTALGAIGTKNEMAVNFRLTARR